MGYEQKRKKKQISSFSSLLSSLSIISCYLLIFFSDILNCDFRDDGMVTDPTGISLSYDKVALITPTLPPTVPYNPILVFSLANNGHSMIGIGSYAVSEG